MGGLHAGEAQGDGLRRSDEAQRKPPQRSLLSEPTTAIGCSGAWAAIGGGVGAHVRPARAMSSTSGTRASA